MAGPILASVTVPFLIYVIWRAEFGLRWDIAAIVILALAVAEGVWALVHVTLGESSPAIWIGPLVVLVAFASLCPVLLVRRAGAHG